MHTGTGFYSLAKSSYRRHFIAWHRWWNPRW